MAKSSVWMARFEWHRSKIAETMLTLLTGAAAGLFHVLTGPDHLAAVAPIAADKRKRGWLAGCTWGIGHASGVVFVAGIAVLLREMLPSIDVI